jgi:hypothetical protein
MGLTMLGTLKSIFLTQRQQYLSLILLRLRLLMKDWMKCKSLEMLIKFRQNESKNVVEYYILSSTNVLVISRIRKNCRNSGRNLLFYCL